MRCKDKRYLLAPFALAGLISAVPAIAQVPPAKGLAQKLPAQQIQPKGTASQPGNQGQPQTSTGWQWNTMSTTTAPLAIWGTGELGLSDTLKKWDTKKVTTASLAIHGTGELGLADGLAKWDTKKTTTAPLMIYGTGSLNP